MNILIIGGTRFIGPRVALELSEAGHNVTLFHRGQTAAKLPPEVQHIYGERRALSSFTREFNQFAPEVVLDMICYCRRDAEQLVSAFKGVARRVVVVSSMDVYKPYGLLLGLESGTAASTRLDEDSPLRESRFPYRAHAKSAEDMAFDYEKILVEQVVMSDRDLPATVLRFPAVYGPGDHRAFEYLKRMIDGRGVILLEEKHARWRWTRGYVENVARAVALCVTDDRSAGRVYNVGEPDAMTEQEWVNEIGRAAGWRGEVCVLPSEKMPGHLRTPSNFDHHLDFDTRRIRDELGYCDATSRSESIKETVSWESLHAPDEVDASFDYDAEDEHAKRCG